MASLKTLLKPSAPLAIEFGGEVINVNYRPQHFTPAFEDALKGLGEKESTPSFLKMFGLIVESWDLKADDADEAPIPLTQEGLRVVPFEIMTEVLSKVQEAVSPKETTESTSGDGLAPVATSGESPTGTPS